MGGVKRIGVGGFTLIEMLMVLTIISALASLSYPVVIQGTKQFQLIQCLQQGRRIGQATLQYIHDGNSPDRTMPVEAWMLALERYGVRQDMWVCPTRKWKDRQRAKGKADFFYAGAPPEEIRQGERIGELYLWVEKIPYHNGLQVIVRGDGRASAENLLKVEF